MPRPLRIALGVSSVFYVLLCLHLPVALYANGVYDDAMFSTHAASILAGHWLGPYDDLTLVKGPGFPLFLALNALLGLPVTLTMALLYAASCLFFAACLYRLTGAAWLTLILFLAIEWHPCVFPMRVARDDISPAQTLLILGCVVQFAFLNGAARRPWRWAVAGGLVLGWFWITREDAIWVAPGLACMLAAELWLRWRRGAGAGGLAGCIGVFLLAAFAVPLAVSAINFGVYGTFRTEDMKSPAFERAVKDLQSVRVGPAVPYVPVPAKVRRAIDAASPAFSALEPYFDGPGKGWKTQTCGFDPATCGEIAGGWFVWALRAAIAWRGDYGSPQQAAAYFGQIAQQVEAACRSGRLTCKPGLMALMPPMTAAQWARLPDALARLYDMLALRDPLELADASSGDPQQMRAMEAVLNRPLRTPTRLETETARLQGWFAPKADGWVQLRCALPEGEASVPIPRLPSPDVAAYFKNPALGLDRFDVTVPSKNACAVEIADGAAAGPAIPLAAAKPGPALLPGGELFIERLTSLAPERRGAGAQRVLLGLRLLYRAVFPLAGAAALLGYLWSLAMLLRGRPADRLLILGTGLWILLLCRGLVLVVVDISAFPAISQVYLLPAFMLTGMASAVSIALPFRAGPQPDRA